MSNLGNQFISASYQSVLNVGTGSGDYITSTLKPLTDGYGTRVPIRVSTTSVELSGSISLTGSLVSSIIPAVSNSIDLGSPTKPFRHLYVGSGSVYLDDHSILSLTTNGADTTVAAPVSGTVNLINDVVFSSQEGLGYEGAPGFTIVGGGTNFQSQTRYSGETISHHTGSQFLTNYWVTNDNVITGDTSLQLEIFKDNLKLASIDNSRHIETYEDSQYTLTSIYNGTGSYNGLVTILHQDNVNSEYSQIGVGDGYAFMGAGNLSGSSPIPQSEYIVLENQIAGRFVNQATSASFELSGNRFSVTGSIAATDGFIGSIQSASFAQNANFAVTASQALNASTADVATVALDSDLLAGTGSGTFATTGSNVFKSGQTISGSLDVTGTITALSASITYLKTIYETSSVIFSSGSNIFGDEASDVQTLNGTVNVPLGNLNITGATTASAGFFGNLQGTASFASNALSASQAQNAVSASQAQNAVSASQSINSNNAVSASQANNANTAVSASQSQNSVSASQAQNAVSASQSQNSSLLNGTGSAVFATTGSNTFIGNETITGSLGVRSGSLSLVSNNTSLVIENFVTNSDAGQSNVIKGWGDNPSAGGASATQTNYTGSLRITGSNNTVSMPQIRATNFAGGTDLQGYISGSENTIAGNNAGIYLNTGSLLFPKITNNYVSNNSNIQMNFTTSSLAGGHPIIQNNTLFAGAIVINSNSGSIQALAGNLLNGGNITSTQNFVTNTRPAISTNILNLTTTLNHISSSINYQNNIANTNVTVNNHLSSSNITNNNLSVSSNVFFGGSTNTGVNIWVSGSQSSNTTRNIIDNLIGGKNIVVSSSFVSSSNSSLTATVVYGQSLSVNGNNGTGTAAGGAAFLGRFNDTGSLANSNEIVFAVGTGTAAATRRTGLYVTSGSLVGVSGSMDVKGNSTISGSLIVTGSLQYASGSNQIMGTFVLDGGNPGVATISNNLVTANSLIFLTKQTNGNAGAGTVSITSKGSGTFSVISSHNGDADTVAYMIVNPA